MSGVQVPLYINISNNVTWYATTAVHLLNVHIVFMILYVIISQRPAIVSSPQSRYILDEDRVNLLRPIWTRLTLRRRGSVFLAHRRPSLISKTHISINAITVYA